MGSPASTRWARRGPSSCLCRGAVRSAWPSTRPIRTSSTPACVRAVCVAAWTAVAAGSTASCPSRECSRSRSAAPTGRCMRAPSRAGCSEATNGARAGSSWKRCSKLPSRPRWSFPPRPWTSHVRWIAPSPGDADLLLVGIELGGLMRSTDGGQSWQDHRPGAQADVHSLAWHPHAAGRAYEAGGGGAAFSTDAGENWRPADDGRDRDYTWSVTVDPDDPDCWYVSASTGPFAAHGRGDPKARIYRRRDGEPWQPLSGGLPEPLPAMPYALLATDGRLFAGLADGKLWESRDRGDSWTPLQLRGGELDALVALDLATP